MLPRSRRQCEEQEPAAEHAHGIAGHRVGPRRELDHDRRLGEERGAGDDGQHRQDGNVGLDPVVEEEDEPTEGDQHADQRAEAEPLEAVGHRQHDGQQRDERDDDLGRPGWCLLQSPEQEREGAEEAEDAVDERADQRAPTRDRHTEAEHRDGEDRSGGEEPHCRRPDRVELVHDDRHPDRVAAADERECHEGRHVDALISGR